MTKLISKTHKQVIAEASALVKDAFVYPKGSARRADLLKEAVDLVSQWKAEREVEDPHHG